MVVGMVEEVVEVVEVVKSGRGCGGPQTNQELRFLLVILIVVPYTLPYTLYVQHLHINVFYLSTCKPSPRLRL